MPTKEGLVSRHRSKVALDPLSGVTPFNFVRHRTPLWVFLSMDLNRIKTWKAWSGLNAFSSLPWQPRVAFDAIVKS